MIATKLRYNTAGLRVIGVGLCFSMLVAVHGADQAPVLESTTAGKASKWSSVAAVQAAAAKGDAEAALELGSMYEFGRGLPADPAMARTLYVQAAAAGVPEADFRLARLLSEGLGGGVDLPGSYERYLRAARAGLPLAQYNVGAMLASARGVKRDYVEGLAWIILASRDSSVDPEGEKRLRARLARRPQDIAAAEQRAAALDKEVSEASGKKETTKDGPPDSKTQRAAAPQVQLENNVRPIVPMPIARPNAFKLPPPPAMDLPPPAPAK